jgi:lipoprotein-anchoring transpeptidase ErfK/SrfK
LQYDKLRHPIDVTPVTLPATTTSPNYLGDQEFVVIPGGTSTPAFTLPITKTLFEYVEIKNSCGVHFAGDCVVARSGPGLDFPVVTQLRNDIVLKVGGQVDHDGHTWYKIIFDEYVRYTERIPNGTMYVAADNVNVLMDEGEKTTWTDGNATTTKRIVVDRATQTLSAYDGDTLFMKTSVSTGLELSPTMAGTFTIYKKTPSRYMQGPLPGYTDVYDLPGVPWNLYFTTDGAVIHGAYWHDSFGTPYSHGCVNLLPSDARKLYNWAPLGTKVTVQ